jgi:hypothetical protein
MTHEDARLVLGINLYLSGRQRRVDLASRISLSPWTDSPTEEQE